MTVVRAGTQRVEEELKRLFPSLIEGETLLRVDGDTMQTAQHFHDALDRFGKGEIRCEPSPEGARFVLSLPAAADD
jgi:primosomal protein N'